MDRAQRDELILKYLWLAKTIAAHRSKQLPISVGFDELVAVANLGLVKAAERYDASRGEFEPYASRRIRGEILDHLRSLDPCKRPLRTLVKNGADVPPIHVISLHGLQRIVSPGIDRNGENFIELEPRDPGASPESRALASDRIRRVWSAVQKLKPKWRRAMELRYRDDLQHAEIGQTLGVNESRASQILSSSIAELRDRLAA